MKDVTNETDTGDVDGEVIPLTKCVCGATWRAWEGPLLRLGSDPRDAKECPSCGRRYTFGLKVTVFQHGGDE